MSAPFFFFEILDPEKTLLNYPFFINTIADKVENKDDLLSMIGVGGFIDENEIVYGHMSLFNDGTVNY